MQRYAAAFDAVEINSTFYRSHRSATLQRWVDSVPPDFRFAVKLPKAISHEQRLVDSGGRLQLFLDDIAVLATKLGPLLLQLPPSLDFEPQVAAAFFATLRDRFEGAVVCEPRHAGWFGLEADRLLADFRVARAAADPARFPAAAIPGGWPGLLYVRLHGSPHIYRSGYEPEMLAATATLLAESSAAERWCVFDNTTLGHATGNALAVRDCVRGRKALKPEGRLG